MDNEIGKAEVGEEYLIDSVEDPFHSKMPKKNWHKGKIESSCGNDSPGIGRWACITHHIVFGNQMNKDGHIQTGHHRLAWWCPKCVTYETP